MKLESLSTRSKRKEILRGVYEENLRITGKETAPPKRRRHREQPTPPRSRWNGRVGLLLVAALLLLGGFQLYRELQARERDRAAEVAALSPAERMARTFGTDADPGRSPEERAATREVPIASLFDLQVRTIVIDPGHGGEDPGAVGPAGLHEKDVTLDVARRLRRRLEQDYGFRILLTREDDRTRSLRERVAFANEHGADLFISIHVNALPVDTVTSVETYYFGLQTDEQTLRLAELENQDSDMSMAEFRTALERIETTMKFQESKQLAVSIQKRLYRTMRRINRAVSDWGVKRGPFVVLLGVEVPSVLAEIAVISNRADEVKLNTPAYREELAAALEAGVVDYLHPAPDPRAPTD